MAQVQPLPSTLLELLPVLQESPVPLVLSHSCLGTVEVKMRPHKLSRGVGVCTGGKRVFCPSTDISAPRGYGGAGGSGTDPTRLSQPFPAPQRQGKSLSNAAGNFTVCYKNTWGWELSERFLCFLHGQLEWKWLEVSPQAHFFFFLFVGYDFWQKRIFSICIFSPLFSLSNSLCFCNEDGV